MVKVIRKRMSRIGCLKLYDLLKPKFEELGIKCGRDKLFKILRDARMLVPKRKNSLELHSLTTCLISTLTK